jgi:hypothetical protein
MQSKDVVHFFFAQTIAGKQVESKMDVPVVQDFTRPLTSTTIKIHRKQHLLVRNLYNLSYFSYVDMLLAGAPSTNSITAQSPSSKPPSLYGVPSYATWLLLRKNFHIPWT